MAHTYAAQSLKTYVSPEYACCHLLNASTTIPCFVKLENMTVHDLAKACKCPNTTQRSVTIGELYPFQSFIFNKLTVDLKWGFME